MRVIAASGSALYFESLAIMLAGFFMVAFHILENSKIAECAGIVRVIRSVSVSGNFQYSDQIMARLRKPCFHSCASFRRFVAFYQIRIIFFLITRGILTTVHEQLSEISVHYSCFRMSFFVILQRDTKGMAIKHLRRFIVAHVCGD